MSGFKLFTKGHLESVTHGAQSDRLVRPRAEALAPVVLEQNPHLDADRDGAAIYRYAFICARLARAYEWLDRQDDPVFADNEKGRAHGVYSKVERWERQAAECEAALAIAPLTRARLGLDLVRGSMLVSRAEATSRQAIQELGRLTLAERSRLRELTEAGHPDDHPEVRGLLEKCGVDVVGDG